MEQGEIEALVGELESRIDRLRSLYDMYFMGIERLEPLVPRKDVERRVAALRKEQIRNTGLRFKFNVIIQRFNTYQTYWLRIARQIEQGTYRRDVMRATARFGIDPTKEQRAAEPDPKGAARGKSAAAAEEVAHEVSMDELEDGSAFLLPLDEDDPFAEISVAAAPAAAARQPRETFGSSVRLDLDDLGDPFEEHDPFPKPAIPSLGPKMRIAPRPGASGAPASLSAPPNDELRTGDPRILAAPAPRIALRVANPPAVQGSAAPPPLARGNESRVIITKRASIPDELERAASARTDAPASPPSSSSVSSPPSLQRPATLPGTASAIARVAAGPPAPGSTVSQAPRSPVLSSPPAAAPRPQQGAPPALPSRAPVAAPSKPLVPGAPPPPRVALAAPSAPRAPAPSAPGLAASANSKAPVATPAVAPLATPRSPPPAVAAAAAAPAPVRPARAPGVGDLSGDRFGEIYSRYVETRRERNEPTHAITREALAKQLHESTERLKQKHGGKPIDFEVVVKDGKTILRPVVK